MISQFPSFSYTVLTLSEDFPAGRLVCVLKRLPERGPHRLLPQKIHYLGRELTAAQGASAFRYLFKGADGNRFYLIFIQAVDQPMSKRDHIYHPPLRALIALIGCGIAQDGIPVIPGVVTQSC